MRASADLYRDVSTVASFNHYLAHFMPCFATASVAPQVPFTAAQRLTEAASDILGSKLDWAFKLFSEGVVLQYRPNFTPRLDAWVRDGVFNVVIGRAWLEVHKKAAREDREAVRMEEAQCRSSSAEWEELLNLGLEGDAGAPARKFIMQGRWGSLKRWAARQRKCAANELAAEALIAA